MPNLALASPSPAAALSPSAPATGLAGAAPEAAGDFAQGSPFATVLQEQLAAQILMPLPAFVGLPAAETAADAPADGAAVAMLPMLLEMAGAQGQADARLAAEITAAATAEITAAATAEDRGDEAATALLPSDAAALVPLALPAIAGTAAHLALERGTGETAPERPAASANAATPAILAAATDAARRSDARAAAGLADEAIAGVGADHVAHRHDAAEQTQAARPAELPQRIEAPVGSRQWDGEFANRLAWMAGRQEQRAELVLTPPALGRIEVSLSVSGDQATAIFTSASATVRDAIENALPRLREVLLESGINLGQAQVGSESPQQSPTREENGDNRGNAVAAGHDSRGMPPGFAVNSPTAWISSGRGMIDIFA